MFLSSLSFRLISDRDFSIIISRHQPPSMIVFYLTIKPYDIKSARVNTTKLAVGEGEK